MARNKKKYSDEWSDSEDEFDSSESECSDVSPRRCNKKTYKSSIKQARLSRNGIPNQPGPSKFKKQTSNQKRTYKKHRRDSRSSSGSSDSDSEFSNSDSTESFDSGSEFDYSEYPVELAKSLRSDDWMRPPNLARYAELEKKARLAFEDPRKDWKDGNTKTYFTYLLLDPRRTNNLPARASNQSRLETWNTFIDSIFYVGKGKRNRPYAHLREALTLWNDGIKRSQDEKIQHILDIWTSKQGVICLHVFQNVKPAEALTYEASMIHSLSGEKLANKIAGSYRGAVASWSVRDKIMLGHYLLHKALQIFLNEGERQLRPEDLVE